MTDSEILDIAVEHDIGVRVMPDDYCDLIGVPRGTRYIAENVRPEYVVQFGRLMLEKGAAGVQPSADAERIAELEEEVAHVRRWYGDRLEILSAWARESLKGEQLHTFFNIVANARPHVSDEPEWFRAVIAKLAAKARTAGVDVPLGGKK